MLAARPFGNWTAPALALAYLMTGEFVVPGLLRFSGPGLGLAQSLLVLLALLRGPGVERPG